MGFNKIIAMKAWHFGLLCGLSIITTGIGFEIWLLTTTKDTNYCTPLDAAGLTQLVADMSAAASGGQAAKLIDAHTKDALILSSTNDIWIKDRAALIEDVEGFMRYTPKVAFRPEVQNITCNQAWSAGHVDVEMRSPKTNEIYKSTERYTMIFSTTSKGWKVSHIHFSQATKS